MVQLLDSVMSDAQLGSSGSGLRSGACFLGIFGSFFFFFGGGEPLEESEKGIEE